MRLVELFPFVGFSFPVAKEENEHLMEEVKTHSHRVHNELKSK